MPLAVFRPAESIPPEFPKPADILSVGTMTWTGWSATALIETFEQELSGQAAIVSLPEIDAPRGIDQLREAILDPLVAAVLSLFPAWLPDAKDLEGPGGAGTSAIIDIARNVAGSSDLLSIFLERMAKAGLKATRSINHADLPREVVSRECAKLLRRAYGVPHLILILNLDDAAAEAVKPAVDEAMNWFNAQGGWKVWLTRPNAEDAFVVDGRNDATENSARAVAPHRRPETSRTIHMTPLSGQPSANSEAEQRLEARLRLLAWAYGRAWNVSWQASEMHNPIRVDLIWRSERCVIEIDGNDHLDPVKYAGDRRRDRDLQLNGFAVLRFTNDEVLGDVENVTRQIEKYIEFKRTAAALGGLSQ